MNPVVVQLTARGLLGRRRVLVLLALPVLVIGLAVLVRIAAGVGDEDLSTAVAFTFVVGTLVPLLGLLVGTSVIGPEIGDGSIVYLLAKPLRRGVIVTSKYVVAVGIAAVFGALPAYVAGWILTGSAGVDALAPAVAALLASVSYCALFLLLAVVSRNAVAIGLLYALVWESVVGQFIPGAQDLSVQQWSLAVADRMLDDSYAYASLEPSVEPGTGLVMIAIVTAASLAVASRRLWRIRIGSDD
jgi:ABC-2 type transport system permease protein